MRISLLIVVLFLSSFLAAQDICSNLQVQVLQHPTEPHLLVVRAENPESEVVNYPSWKIMQGDVVVAEGETFFFQLPSISHHIMDALIPIVEGENYDFELELYESFGSTLVCTVPFSGVVYDPNFCIEGELTFYPTENLFQEIEIRMLDEFGSLLVDENLFFDSQTLPFSISLCLDRACYQITIEAVGSALQANALLGFMSSDMAWFSEAVPSGENLVVFEIDFYEGCSFVSVEERAEADNLRFPSNVRCGGLLSPLTPFSSPVNLELFDIQGKRCLSQNGSEIKMPEQAGIYILQWSNSNGEFGSQKVVVSSGY